MILVVVGGGGEHRRSVEKTNPMPFHFRRVHSTVIVTVVVTAGRLWTWTRRFPSNEPS